MTAQDTMWIKAGSAIITFLLMVLITLIGYQGNRIVNTVEQNSQDIQNIREAILIKHPELVNVLYKTRGLKK